MSDIESTLDAAADAVGYARNALRAQKATIAEQAAELERLRATVGRVKAASRPFVETAGHTRVFLTSRQKMHQDGVRQYDDEVAKLSAALDDAGAAGEDGA